MKLKVLVTGASGLVGSRFIELYKGRYDFVTPEYPRFDLTDKKNVTDAIKEAKPDVVVNFAAFTNVGEAENQRNNKKGDCYKINVTGVKNLIEALPPECHFIQISTDMVFPGSSDDKGPYSEDHRPETDSRKLTWYGYTKALGEAGCDTILRLIYPVRARYDLKMDYLRKPLALYDEGKLYPMFADQQVSIAFVDDVAKALEKIIDGRVRGVFHAGSNDTTTPFELISSVLEKARGVKDVVKPVLVDEFLKTAGNPVRYPKYGGLKVEKTEKELGIKFSSWREIVGALASNW